MAKRSAGLMTYRWRDSAIEVFLVHPGGPFWVNKDTGVWSVAKGEHAPGEDALTAAQREFQEETSFLAGGPFLALGEVRLTSGKVVTAWAFEGDCDPRQVRSNTCEIEWPPRSGRRLEIPEVDRGAWFSLVEAGDAIAPAQRPFLERLVEALKP